MGHPDFRIAQNITQEPSQVTKHWITQVNILEGTQTLKG